MTTVPTTRRQTPRSFRLQRLEWDQLKIVALQEGYKSRHAYLTAHVTAIANASIEKLVPKP